MSANVCGRERIIRGVLGLVLVIIAFIVGATAGWIMGIIGGFLLLTALFSYCPFNTLFHHNSCPIERKNL